jgi:lipopolysaccharide transport system permease protein
LVNNTLPMVVSAPAPAVPRAEAAPKHRPPATVIAPVAGWGLPRLGEVWAYRELLWTLTSRDIRVRYKQTAIGIAWAGLQPLLAMVVFTVIFGNLAKLPSDGLPYPVFAMAALLPWQFFQKALTQGSLSLVTLSAMLTKVYFPRILAPLSAVLSGGVDFAIGFVILLGLMAWYGAFPSLAIVLLPFFAALAVLTALGVSLWLAAVNVRYRDVQHALPFLAQLWLYATPVVYPASLVPGGWRLLYMVNPMAGVVEGFRWALLNPDRPPDLAALGVSVAAVLVLLLGGLVYFDRAEKTFADTV